MRSPKKSIPKSTAPLSPSRSAQAQKNTPRSKSKQPKLSNTPKQESAKMMSKSRVRLAEALDTYTLLIRSNIPIRCLQHNSNISIYCETQQKLLCANCIFGRTQHKFHRVTPVDKNLDKIEKDIETMNRLIDRELQTIDKTSQKIMENLALEQTSTHQGLSTLIKVYEECHKRLQENFLKSKQNILIRFQKVRNKYEKMLFDLKQLAQDYGISSLMKSLHRFKRQELLLFQHSVCTAIIQQKRFQQKDWLSNRQQVQIIVNQERKKISGVFDILQKLSPSEK